MRNSLAIYLLLSLTSFAIAKDRMTQKNSAEGPGLNESGNAFRAICEIATEAKTPMGAVCMGYSMGLSEGIASFADTGGIAQLYCSPDGVTVEQNFRILLKYIKDHPEKAHMQPRDLMLSAMIDAFPCLAAPAKPTQ